jgi:hypothetical protein
MKNVIVSLMLMVSFAAIGYGQSTLTWKQLADVKYEPRYFKEINQKILTPLFGKTPKAYEGKEVLIAGYVLPLDVKLYALSKFPYASCFFCGGAGAETIIELQLHPKAATRYKMDEWRTFKGTLRLNDSDVMHFNYILENAMPVAK